jgi:hypothetical protein
MEIHQTLFFSKLAIILTTVILLGGEIYIFVHPLDNTSESPIISYIDECVNDVIHNNGVVSCKVLKSMTFVTL